MNPILKLLVAVMGACNYVMQILMPLIIGLSVFVSVEKTWNAYLLLLVAAFASLYQGAKIFVKE